MGSNLHSVKIKRSRALLAIVIAAVILRICAALYLGNTFNGEQQTRIFDQVSYHQLAKSLLNGQGYSFEKYWYPFTPANTPTAHWSFIYPAFLATVYAVFGETPLAARILQALVSGILGAWLSYRLGRQLFGERVGIVAAALTAVNIYLIFHDVALMTESFYILGVMASLLLALEIAAPRLNNLYKGELAIGANRPELAKWISLGAVLGLAALLRQAILLWAPFLYLWICWWVLRQNQSGRSRFQLLRGPLLSLGILAAFILPWTVRNWIVYESFLPLNSNAGYALFASNHPHHGTNFDQDYVAKLPEDLRGQGLNEAQFNSLLTKRGLDWIIQDPGRYLLLSLDRVGVFFNFWFSSESSTSSNIMRLLSYTLYLPFFVYGLFLSLKEWRKASLVYLFAAIYSLMHILTWASIRYRLPVDAALMPFGALAITSLASRKLNQAPFLKNVWVDVPPADKLSS